MSSLKYSNVPAAKTSVFGRHTMLSCRKEQENRWNSFIQYQNFERTFCFCIVHKVFI